MLLSSEVSLALAKNLPVAISKQLPLPSTDSIIIYLLSGVKFATSVLFLDRIQKSSFFQDLVISMKDLIESD